MSSTTTSSSSSSTHTSLPGANVVTSGCKSSKVHHALPVIAGLLLYYLYNNYYYVYIYILYMLIDNPIIIIHVAAIQYPLTHDQCMIGANMFISQCA